MSKLAKALTAAAGNAGGDNLYVEDVFSTYLYTGTGSSQSINNGIDLAGEGGLVWIKDRGSSSRAHYLFDSEHLAAPYYNQYLSSNDADAIYSATGTGNGLGGLFNDNGFPVQGNHSTSGVNYASWTFRKAEKFFDVVTYTGDGQTFRNLNHSLNGDIGTIIVKRTDSTSDWYVLSRNSDASNGVRFTKLNSTAAGAYDASNHSVYWTDTTFRPALVDSTATNTNISGATYVAYLFASDAGGFGDDGSESIIKCGSYAGTSSANKVTLGFEPQWLLIKASDKAESWWIVDAQRGLPVGGAMARLYANGSDFEESYLSSIDLNADGFTLNTGADGAINRAGFNYIYIAIRRPMKTPESGTEVFAIDSWSSGEPNWTSSFPVDFGMVKSTASSAWYQLDRLRGEKGLKSNSTAAETSETWTAFDNQDGFGNLGGDSSYYSWMFKRATGFFDVVAYTGTGVAGRTVNHNLGVAPELMIVKARNATEQWLVYANGLGNTKGIVLSSNGGSFTNSAFWNNTDPNNSAFILGTNSRVNSSGNDYIAYLFSTLDGVSKVGSYIGDGTSGRNIDCGFSSGARFILIKKEGVGDWNVWDSARGIIAGNDPYLSLNRTSAETTGTDLVDPSSSGFIINNDFDILNASGSTYIFLAIA